MTIKTIDRLQFLTCDTEGISHEQQAELACAGGIRWMQFRMKTGSEEQRLAAASAVKTVSSHFGATLIINDDVMLAKTIGADGVHLGKNDMDITSARNILGPGFIIGGTANTVQDILALAEKQVDYIGLGPYRFTATKQNLSPVLGSQGYSRIMSALSTYGINIPVIAIGGIRPEDVAGLSDTGVHGIAISSGICNKANIKAAANRWVEICQQYFQNTTLQNNASNR